MTALYCVYRSGRRKKLETVFLNLTKNKKFGFFAGNTEFENLIKTEDTHNMFVPAKIPVRKNSSRIYHMDLQTRHGTITIRSKVSMFNEI